MTASYGAASARKSSQRLDTAPGPPENQRESAMLRVDERATLVIYCQDHAVAICPDCSTALRASEVGTELILGRRDFCPQCRADLTAVLREHLTECT